MGYLVEKAPVVGGNDCRGGTVIEKRFQVENSINVEVVCWFIEKPEVPTSDFVSIGLYLYPRAIVARVREYLDDGNNPDAPGYFVAWLLKHATIRSHQLEGVWWDIGSLETLAQARAAYGEA